MGGAVADQSETQTSTQAVRIFDGSFCKSISYFVKGKGAEVKSDSFLEAVGFSAKEAEGRRAVFHCAPKNPESDFHLHVSWRFRKGVLGLEVEFVSGATEKQPGEKEPFAEGFMAWVEKFFVNKSQETRMRRSSHVSPPLGKVSSRCRSKPLLGRDTELEIDGISFALSGKPEGIAKIWLTQDENVWIHLLAQAPRDLRTISPKADIEKFSRVLDTILEEKKQ